jgi:hypothetical protein
MTSAQEEEARRSYYEAARDPDANGGWDEGLFPPDDRQPSRVPSPTSRPGGPPQSAATGAQPRTASPADVRAVAQRAGISEADARQRLELAGVMLLLPSH